MQMMTSFLANFIKAAALLLFVAPPTASSTTITLKFLANAPLTVALTQPSTSTPVTINSLIFCWERYVAKSGLLNASALFFEKYSPSTRANRSSNSAPFVPFIAVNFRKRFESCVRSNSFLI